MSHHTAAPDPAFDLDAYLARIAYAGPRTPTLATLRELHRLHPQAIAFENLDPLRKRAVELDLPTLMAKLVHGGRGGYCFEHNLLLREALLALGFAVRALAARVVWNAPPDAPPGPRSHMLLAVPIGDTTYIADVGFGGQVLTGPLDLGLRLEQATPHEPYRLRELAGSYALEARLGAAWSTLYHFDLTEQLPVDYVATSYYLSTHARSHFTQRPIAARTEPGIRHALRGTSLATHHTGGASERVELTTVAALRAALVETFRITLPDDPALDAALGAAVAPPL